MTWGTKVEVPIAFNVRFLLGLVYDSSILLAKDARSIMSQNQNPDASGTDSAETALVKYHLPPQFASHNVSVKCTTENRATLHEFVVVKPEVETPEGLELDPMKILELAKRLKICTECGKMSFTN